MSFFRRKRRPDDGRYLPKDRQAWSSLVTWAEEVAARPNGARGLKLLGAVARRCTKAVPPPGYITRDSIFLRLALEARDFCTCNDELRGLKAPALAELAAKCGEVLARPTERYRADLEG